MVLLGRLLFLGAGQLYLAAVVVGVGPGHPAPQPRLADAQVFREPGDLFGAFAGEFDGPPPELWGVVQAWGHPSRRPRPSTTILN
jgi:hypothetical protein